MEIICALVATITYKHYKDSPAKIFLPFLWFLVSVETIGLIPKLNYFHPDSFLIHFLRSILPAILIEKNHWIYNTYSIVSFLVFISFYKRLVIGRKRLFDILITSYIISVLYDLVANTDIYLHSIYIFHKIIGVLTTLTATFYYFVSMFNNDEIIKFNKSLPFWITIGLLFFNLITIPIFIFANQFNFTGSLYIYILTTSSFVMYTSFVIGFISNAREHHKILQNKRDLR